MDAHTDEQLVAAYVAGDRGALHELVGRYERRVYGICYRYFGNAADAEDAAQEAFVALLRRAETFTGAARFSTWMYRVAVNACNDLSRKRARRPQSAGEDISEMAERLPDPTDALGARELSLELGEGLSLLDEQTRTAIVLHDVQGFGYADVAERLGLPVGTVKSRIHRGHARLAAALGHLHAGAAAPDTEAGDAVDGEPADPAAEPRAPEQPPTQRHD